MPNMSFLRMHRMRQRRKQVLHPWIVSVMTLQVQLLIQDDGHTTCEFLWSFVMTHLSFQYLYVIAFNYHLNTYTI